MTSVLDTVLAIDLLNIMLLTVLFMTAIAVARMNSLFAIVMLSGVFSLTSATWFVALDAVDVAFTEASVGAGISTALFLGAMLLTARSAKPVRREAQLLPLLVVVATGAVLIYASLDLPQFGDPASPANTYVGVSYLERTVDEIGIPNVVTAVLASYRGFDTLGEVGVVYSAGLAVVLLLGIGERSLGANPHKLDESGQSEGDHHVVLRVVSKPLLPIVVLFGLYVQFHGDFGPGGGFQAGVILAVSVILHALIFGLGAAMRAVSPGFARGLAGFGFLLYAGIGVWALAMGGDFLDYDALFNEPPGGHLGQHWGIILIELGVLFAVAGSMVAIFYAFAGRVSEIRDEDW